MDVVLVGLPGSGKSMVGRRLAHRHGAQLLDLDEMIEAEAGRSITEIFATEGETGFRARERASIEALGRPDGEPQVRRVIATGGGAVVDPRNRWRLYRDRFPVWLDVRPEVLAQRLRRSPNIRPLVAGRDPIGSIRALAAARERFYGAAHRVNGVTEVAGIVAAIEGLIGARPADRSPLVRARTRLGDIVIGDGIAASAIVETLERLGAQRAIVLSEPGAWVACGERLAIEIRAAGVPVVSIMLPQGEAAKRLAVVEATARELARHRVERGEPLIAIGGGALGDTAGFVAATYLRGVPVVHVPSTLVGQIDSAIGGKTAVDLPEGKNLVGAFHQPEAIVIDVGALASLPVRERRAALGEAVKMAVLGDERLLELLELDGEAIARGDDAVFASGAVAELVERAAWAKVEIVSADERETDAAGGRITLNLGHSLGHAVEAAGGYVELRHGEAVAYGLRAATEIAIERGLVPEGRAARIFALLARLGLGQDRLPYSAAAVRDALATDKKHAGGRLRWVLPDATGVVVRADVPETIVERAIAGLLVEGARGTSATDASPGPSPSRIGGGLAG